VNSWEYYLPQQSTHPNQETAYTSQNFPQEATKQLLKPPQAFNLHD
jgi:hypothetical protein